MTAFESILLSALHLTTFTLYNLNYARLRKDRRYAAEDKPQVEAMPLARKITKVAFVTGTGLVFLGFWLGPEVPGFFALPFSVRSAGLVITLMGFLMLRKSLSELGENYSPLFDTHRPREIVRSGMYRQVRHPVYLSNMIIILGYLVAAGTVWILPTTFWGWAYMLRSVIHEENYLSREFPDYRTYQSQTWKLIPYLF